MFVPNLLSTGVLTTATTAPEGHHKALSHDGVLPTVLAGSGQARDAI